MRRPQVIIDSDLAAMVRPDAAVAWMREAVIAAEAGKLRAPARVWSDLGDRRLVFTCGSLAGDWFGYRSYDTPGTDPGQQLVVVQDAYSGEMRGIAIGNLLGQLRTGALGGLAVDVLTDPTAASVGMIGSGSQAWTQLWAINGIRHLVQVDVYSPTPGHAEAFATRARGELGIACRAVTSAEVATREHAIVVLATDSGRPVIDADWIASGAHVTTLGPKQRDRAEFDLDLVQRAGLLVTDSVTQLTSYDPPALVATSEHRERVMSLGAVVSNPARAHRSAADLTLYLSVGLAGTDVYLLSRLITQPRPE